MNINYCKGCEKCEVNRECVQMDDMNLLIDEIYESDIILGEMLLEEFLKPMDLTQ